MLWDELIIGGTPDSDGTIIPFHLVAFPVKRHWRDPADPSLIVKSAFQLVELTDREGWRNVALPRPGCGNGRLDWEVVRPLLNLLDDRFVVVYQGG